MNRNNTLAGLNTEAVKLALVTQATDSPSIILHELKRLYYRNLQLEHALVHCGVSIKDDDVLAALDDYEDFMWTVAYL